MTNTPTINQQIKTMTTNTPIIYRVSFTKNLSVQMTMFAKIHQQKSAKEFRQEWQTWINTKEIQELVSETIHQNSSDYNINTLYDKIYESMRYHRRKTVSEPPINDVSALPPPQENQLQPPSRKKTTTFSQTFIKIITNHIQQNYHEKPENAYKQFAQIHNQEILQEKQYLLSKYDESILYDLDHEHTNIHYNKFKRNYKNSFQQYKKQINL